MKFTTLIAAATLALSSASAFAGTYSFSGDTAIFKSDPISNILPSFTQDITFTNLVAGTYNILGDISGTNLNFTSVLLNGNAWSLYANSKGKFTFGDIDYTGTTPLLLHVEGTNIPNKLSNYTGSLTVTPVPEAETSSMMLLG